MIAPPCGPSRAVGRAPLASDHGAEIVDEQRTVLLPGHDRDQDPEGHPEPERAERQNQVQEAARLVPLDELRLALRERDEPPTAARRCSEEGEVERAPPLRKRALLPSHGLWRALRQGAGDDVPPAPPRWVIRTAALDARGRGVELGAGIN